ncbi:Pep3/Vps18/deep orange family-domain-containing protein [Halteromyces radiatus]|uniref:Pep3/Vps18/deep orange family-domain-containing protein n=1 Tax=Halteromyces radiatus TaxID=101107 RepID=UPI00221E8977|nr:Pep3/Vps18/deep orange family-domain-containing protein [Halteromyces radiatus]KAI8088938.1 Pep3/Vps18/deep orange family-domain-containing protein [Halteromyces radiatus]
MSLFDDFLESTENPQEQTNGISINSLSYENYPTNNNVTDDTLLQRNQPSTTISQTSIKSISSTIFNLDYVQFQLPALLIYMVVSNNILLAVLSNNHILRIDLDNPLQVEEIDLVRKPNDGKIVSVFFDPTGRHLILSTEQGENYYLYGNWKKTKVLSRFKGLVITSIGWNHQATMNSTATLEILLGTNKGEIYETWIEPTDEYFKKEERYLKLLYQLSVDSPTLSPSLLPSQIVGLHFESIPAQKYLVMVTTANRLYQFIGITNPASSAGIHETGSAMFKPLFSQYTNNVSFQELPGDIGWSGLYLYNVTTLQRSSEIFAWVTGPGVYQGRIDVKSEKTDDLIDNAQLILYPTSVLQDGSTQQQPDIPIAMSLTAFHIIFLYQHRVKVICHLNNKLVYDESIPLESNEKIQGLAVDNSQKTYWIYTTAAIYEIVIKNEDEQAWKLYLDKKDYTLALEYCRQPEQRNKVYIAQADQLFLNGAYQQSAKYYAVTNMSFEQVALKFISRNEKDALRVYLLAKLQQLDDKARTQKSIIATWLVEIFLAKINQYHEMGTSVAYTSTHHHDGINKGQSALDYYRKREHQVKYEFKQLLETYEDYFHKETVYKLIASHGHNAELVYYATLIGDDEKVMSHWITERNWMKALAILGKQVKLDMFYKYSPILMEYVPRETVDIWMLHTKLNPRMLIPSLLRYNHNTVADKATQHQAIRYLSYVVTTLGNTDPVVHNSLLALYATQSTTDETALLSFLKNEGREMYYNPDYALRLCSQFGRLQSCIHLYSLMGLYEEAVHLALRIGDIDLARIHADKPFGDEELGKKLWLAIAKYVIKEKNDIKLAMDYVKQSNILKIEDILPFFPDFILIDEFKDDIYKALEEYNGHIGVLKSEMDDATKSVNNIRLDVRSLKTRFTELDEKDQCCICEFPLLTRQFYVFPCHHSYHMDCLINKTTKHLPFRQIRKLADLQEQLSRDIKLQNKLQHVQMNKSGKDMSRSTSTTLKTPPTIPTTDAERDEFGRIKARIERLKSELDDIVANECVYCGQIMIDSIDEPLIALEENEVVLDWMI